MSEATPPTDAERRLRNLQAVARHHARPRTEETTQPGVSARWKRKLATFGPLGVVAIFVLGKLKLLLPLLKFVKISTLLTMLLAVWAYAMLWGLPFAVGFVLLQSFGSDILVFVEAREPEDVFRVAALSRSRIADIDATALEITHALDAGVLPSH